MATLHEKKLIQLFTSFVEKTFLPLLRKNEQINQQWLKFHNFVLEQNINYYQLQNFVENISNKSSNDINDRKYSADFFLKKNLESPATKQINHESESTGFNPSKTFGGYRAKMAMFPIKSDIDDFNQQPSRKQTNSFKQISPNVKDQSFKKTVPQSAISGLDRLHRLMLENQHKIQQLAGISNGFLANSQQRKFL